MAAWVALLRAVNVGGKGKLAMTDLATLCVAAGFRQVRTYIASGNVVFAGDGDEATVRATLECRLCAHCGREVGVLVRSAAEMAGVRDRNPFPDAPGSRVLSLFVDHPLPADPLSGAAGHANERVAAGERELFILYPDGMATSRLRLPGERTGTARNMNTVARLAEMAAALG